MSQVIPPPLRTLAAALVLVWPLGLPTQAQAQSTWIGPDTGSWLTPENWSNTDVPDTLGEDARIDNNSGQATTVSLGVTTASTGIDIGNLVIDAGDRLNITGFPSTTIDIASLSNSGIFQYSFNHNGSNGGTTTMNMGGTDADGNIFNNTGATINLLMHTSRNQFALNFLIAADNTNNGNIVASVNWQDRDDASFQLTGSGEFVNNGLITLQYTNEAGSLRSGSPSSEVIFRVRDEGAVVTLGGTGTLIMSEAAPTNNVFTRETKIIGSTSGTSTLTNGSGHTIQGTGLIGGNSLKFYNDGLVEATGDVEELTIASNTSTPTNQPENASIVNNAEGVFRASGAAGMLLQGRFVTNDGEIQVAEGSKLIIASGTVLNNGLTGTMDIDGTLAGSGTVNFAAGGLTLGDDAALAPGSSAGTLNLGFATGERLALSDLTQLNFELGTPGLSDLVNINGGLTLDGVLNITALPEFGEGLYTLFQFSSGTLIDNGLVLGISPESYQYQIIANDTNVQVQVTAVPQPSQMVLILCGLGGIILTRGRMRKRGEELDFPDSADSVS